MTMKESMKVTGSVSAFLAYPNAISYIKFEYFGAIHFLVTLQTNRQTELNSLPTPTDSVGTGNYRHQMRTQSSRQ